MEFPSEDTAPGASAQRPTKHWIWALVLWVGFVYVQYSLRTQLHFSFWNTLWSRVGIPFSATSFPRFIGARLVSTFFFAAFLQLAARLIGSRTPFRNAAPVWFLLVAAWPLFSVYATSAWAIWILRLLQWIVYVWVFKRLYRFSWGQTAGGWVLAGTLSGGVLMCLGVVRVARLVAGLPWQTLLQSPALQRTNGVADLDWTLRTEDGQSLNLQDARGKFLFISLWSPSSIPSRLELPSMQRLYQHYQDNPMIDFFLISEEPPLTVWRFVRDHPYALPFYTAAHRPASFAYSGVPVTFIVSPAGRIVARQDATLRWDSDGAFRSLDRLLNDPQLARTGVPSPSAVDKRALNSLLLQGRALSQKGLYTQAEAVLNKLLLLRRDIGEDMDFVNTLYELGNVHYLQRHWSVAETFYKQALLEADQLLAPDDPHLARYYDALGNVDYSEGRISEAEVLHAKAISLSKKSPADEQAQYMRHYADDLRRLGRSAEAGHMDHQAGRLEKR